MAAKDNPELVAASAALEQAMMDWLQAGGGDKKGMVVDYLILIEQQGFDEDGDPDFTLKWKGRDHQPFHRTIGLMRTWLIRMEARVAGNADIAHRLP